jgi:TonB family protein
VIDALTASPLAWAAARALVAFVWQGAIIGTATAIGLLLLRRSSAHLRYQLACIGLAALCTAPLATGLFLFDPHAASSQRALTPAMREQPDAISRVPGASPVGAQDKSNSTTLTSVASATAWLNSRLPALLLVWAAGVFALALRLGAGWINVARLRREATSLNAHPVAASAARIAHHMGVRRHVRLLSSARVLVPAVIGWIRPAILLPAAVLSGMPAAHLDAILAHELAHIRRSDFLVNVLQSAAEVLLFYHPAVWWVSRQIRVERELCADDLAVAISGDRVTYATALTSLESLRAEPLAIAMVSGDDLLTRVKRLLDPDVTTRPRISGGFAMTVAMMLLLFALTGTETSTSAAGPVIAQTQATPVPSAAMQTAAPVKPSPAAAKPRPAESTDASPTARAEQASRSQVTGFVRDKDGGVLPGVLVTIGAPGVPLDNPSVIRVFTNARGVFSFPDVQPGEYELSASLHGFRTNRSRLSVATGASPSVVIVLEIGSVRETITVRQPAAPGTARATAPSQLASQYFDLAKIYYQAGRLLEAEEMTTKALALMRSEMPSATPAPLADATSGPIRVGGSVDEPKKIRDVKPVYPPIAAAAAVEGTVIIEAVVGVDGTVQNARVIRSVPLLDEGALEAVRQWQYTPTKLNGRPVEVLVTVSITFMR